MVSKAADRNTVIVGLGATGLSCARFLAARGRAFAVVDSRDQPPGLEELRRLCPQTELELGALDGPLLTRADQIVLSPGLDPRLEPIAAAVAAGATLLGDVELFYHEARAPIVAITGSNAKSTVTSMVGAMAAAAGRRVGLGGNLGTPVLDLLDDAVDLYVLELSSFQLDTVIDFRAETAAFLNFCADHLDRYDSLESYRRSKQRIFRGAATAVCNRDDQATWPTDAESGKSVGFILGPPAEGDFGLRRRDGVDWLARGLEMLMPVTELRLPGRHNQANALAALAIGHSVDLPMEAMLAALRSFSGLPHRCQQVDLIDGVRYVDDSKATNVGAAVASIRGLAQDSRILLIAGGIAKESDFSPLREELGRSGRAAMLIGDAAETIAACLEGVLPLEHCQDMDAAVRRARSLAQSGDTVLLAPACASFDMFDNFAARGDAFARAVRQLRESANDG